MPRDVFERHAAVRLLVYATAIIALLYALGMAWGIVVHFANVILVLFLAWIIAFALRPFPVLLERLRMPRVVAVASTYLALLALAVGTILLAMPTLRAQAEHLGVMLAGLFSTGNIDALGNAIAGFLQGLGFSATDARGLINQVARQFQTTAGSLAGQAITGVESMFGQAMTLLFNATVVVILSFYMMLDGTALVERLIKRLPPAWIPDVRLFQMHVDSIFGGFLRAAGVITLAYAALTWIVLAALGQPGSVLFALLSGMLFVVPWVGGFLAIIPPAVLVLLDSSPSDVVRNLIILVIALFIAQQVIMQIVAPRVIGAHMGLHPLLVFAAVLVGASEAGIWGVLFGPPVAAVIVAMLDTFFDRWQRTSGKYPDLNADQPADQERTQPADDARATEDSRLVELPR